jgi:hypothetical protein
VSRQVSARITEPTGTPREGTLVELVDGSIVSAITDASGVFVATVETDTTYTFGPAGAGQIDGVPYPAGTVFTLSVPEGEGTATFAESLVSTTDASPAALLARLVALEEAAQIPSPPPVMAQQSPDEGEVS